MSQSRFAVVCGTALFAASCSSAFSAASVVLGSKSSFTPSGKGWGTVAPRSLDNGGDPSGRAWNIRWQNWGASITSGSGLTYVAPASGHGWVKGRVQLRAERIGRCAPSGPRAYTRLEVRVAPLDTDRFGAWVLWNGRPNLCRASR